MNMMSDILMDALEHSWGISPKQKKREKEYNAEYYRKHKEKWNKYISDNVDYRYNMDGLENYNREDSSKTRNAKKYYLEMVTNAAKSKNKSYNGQSLSFWQDQYKWAEDQLNAQEAYNKRIAAKRSSAGQAENERSKAKDRAVAIRNQYADKQLELEVYESSTKGKIDKMIKDAKHKLSDIASEASKTITAGIDAVNNLFKTLTIPRHKGRS